MEELWYEHNPNAYSDLFIVHINATTSGFIVYKYEWGGSTFTTYLPPEELFPKATLIDKEYV